MTALDDLELLRRFARGGDESAFETLVKRHASLVYSAACRISARNAAQAQDISQLVFSHLAARGADVLVRAESNRAALPPESMVPPHPPWQAGSTAKPGLRHSNCCARRDVVAAGRRNASPEPQSRP